jgi:hypothetical protein
MRVRVTESGRRSSKEGGEWSPVFGFAGRRDRALACGQEHSIRGSLGCAQLTLVAVNTSPMRTASISTAPPSPSLALLPIAAQLKQTEVTFAICALPGTGLVYCIYPVLAHGVCCLTFLLVCRRFRCGVVQGRAGSWKSLPASLIAKPAEIACASYDVMPDCNVSQRLGFALTPAWT